MTVTASLHRQSHVARRAGYTIGAVVNAGLLVAINATPGWAAVPFLSPAMTDVLPLVNASLALGVAANLVYATADPPWLRSLGDLVTTALGLTALISIWRVFPFDFPATSASWPLDWGEVARVVLVVSIAGSAVAIGVQAGRLVRHLAQACGRDPQGGSR